MKRPTVIRVFGKPFAVSFVPRGHSALMDGPKDKEDPGLGITVLEKQRIAIDNDLPLEMEQDTVLHETIHCIEDGMKMDLSEEVVERLAAGLLSVFKENPDFLRYMSKTRR